VQSLRAIMTRLKVGQYTLTPGGPPVDPRLIPDSPQGDPSSTSAWPHLDPSLTSA